MPSVFETNVAEARSLLDKVASDRTLLAAAEKWGQLLVDTYRAGGKVLICGNGGSYCDALHFAEELTGRFQKDRAPLGAIALGEGAHMSCVANDYGYEHVFSRQVEALGRKGDIVIGISTSGKSSNVIMAIERAKTLGFKTVGLLGKGGGLLRELVDIPLVVPHDNVERIQEVHIKLIHAAIEHCERALYPENYRA